MLNACYNGSFHKPGYITGYYIFGPGRTVATAIDRGASAGEPAGPTSWSACCHTACVSGSMTG